MTKTVEQKVLKFIDENHLIQKGDKILIALSGGADSVFLLTFLLKYRKLFGIDLAAFHLNHKLRGKDADADEKFCRDFCSERKIKFISAVKDVKSYSKKNKLSIEEAGRILRYGQLKFTAVQNNYTKIATAHNASDNIETILLNLFKGTGLKGLTGIPVKRENIIRPILPLSSQEIRKYLKVEKIPFRVDKSNLDSNYERNFLRNEIVPKLKERLSPRLEEKISSTSKIISEINSFVEKQIKLIAGDAVKFEADKLLINIKPISKLDKNMLSIFLKSVIEKHLNIELLSENIYALTNLAASETGKSVVLKENVIAFKERSELVIGKNLSQINEKKVHQLNINHAITVNDKIITIEQVKRKNVKLTSDKSVEFISGDSVKKDFTVRNWKDGDKFHPIGMKGTKKVSDFLADIRIPSHKKKEQLVLTNSGKIVWVMGLRLDDRFKLTPGTKLFLKLKVN